MNQAEYETMYRLETHYWWFVARRQLVTSLVNQQIADTKGARILDVGCGTGATRDALTIYGEVFGADMSEEALSFSRSRGGGPLTRSRIERLSFIDGCFDLITALDVLEHADDDLASMDELYRALRPGGLLIVTVPAYGFLWSEHDEALHHRRRYAAYELRNKLTRVGFEIERLSFFITFLFFPILAMRFVQNIFKKSVEPKTSHIILPDWLNNALIGLLAIERWLLRYINLPFGVTIVCLARKPELSAPDLIF
ncbi:MAG TPA: methyltransferase domain-containing protein [Blastocatellia bacterium]|nr:methyltransferase domain-containing protein [Blastocatellia bacterium]